MIGSESAQCRNVRRQDLHKGNAFKLQNETHKQMHKHTNKGTWVNNKAKNTVEIKATTKSKKAKTKDNSKASPTYIAERDGNGTLRRETLLGAEPPRRWKWNRNLNWIGNNWNETEREGRWEQDRPIVWNVQQIQMRCSVGVYVDVDCAAPVLSRLLRNCYCVPAFVFVQ